VLRDVGGFGGEHAIPRGYKGVESFTVGLLERLIFACIGLLMVIEDLFGVLGMGRVTLKVGDTSIDDGISATSKTPWIAMSPCPCFMVALLLLLLRGMVGGSRGLDSCTTRLASTDSPYVSKLHCASTTLEY
jgi:hypothetical protein